MSIEKSIDRLADSIFALANAYSEKQAAIPLSQPEEVQSDEETPEVKPSKTKPEKKKQGTKKQKNKTQSADVTEEDIRAAAVALKNAKSKAAVVSVLNAFGASVIKDLAEEDYTDALSELNAELAANS